MPSANSLTEATVGILTSIAMFTISPSFVSAQLVERYPERVLGPQGATRLNGLAIAVKEEKRDVARSAQMEADLWTSYVGETKLRHNALKSVDCQGSNCVLEVQMNDEKSSTAAIEREIAIQRWVSSLENCAYAMSSRVGSAQPPGVLRIFLDCKE